MNSWLNHHNANEVPSAEQCGLLQLGTSQACKNRTLQRALVAWILVQLLVMQRYFFLQPVIAALAIVELALVRVWHRAGSAGRARRQYRPVLHG